MAQKKVEELATLRERVAAVERKSPVHLTITRQCELLSISRATFYYQPASETPENLTLMREIDQIHLDYPFLGSRRITDALNRADHRRDPVNRKRVRRLMSKMGIVTVYPKPNTSAPDHSHTIYPYLIRDRAIGRPNEVWCADITYIPMERGFMYLVAIMDWYSRFVLAWELSNTMETDFCLIALEAAIARWGCAEIFNTDQGSQFTANAFTEAVEAAEMLMSMDGKGRWMDNRFIERLWRSLKYEEIYLKAYEDGLQLREGTDAWMNFYSYQRPHQGLSGRTPWEMYQ